MEKIRRLPDIIPDTIPGAYERLLIFGEPGSGKSTLASDIARALCKKGMRARLISADPGSPAFGAPGAVSLGEWGGETWRLLDYEALLSLNAARFRLPLIQAVRRLIQRSSAGQTIIDAPGVTRGVGGAELLAGLVEAAGAGAILALSREGEDPPLSDELSALAAEVFLASASPLARRPGKGELARRRTLLWDEFLSSAEERELVLDDYAVIGTPPPVSVREEWIGRQAALLSGDGRTLGMGEITAMDGAAVAVRLRGETEGARAILVRDAKRVADGLLRTAPRRSENGLRHAPPPKTPTSPGYSRVVGPRPIVRAGAVTASLVNGVFGDPLLTLRPRLRKRHILFDMGGAERLPARATHQVTDVFITHAHIDHIGGFLWLLRSRIGFFPTVRIFGPPGISGNIMGMINGVLWDRIGGRGPRFEVGQFDGERIERSLIIAGAQAAERLDDKTARDGTLLDEPEFSIRAAALDHDGTPSLAFSFESSLELNVRKDALAAMGQPPGPWLSELKRRIAAKDEKSPIALPGGGEAPAGALAEKLLIRSPGRKLVYAADLADTPENRERLVALARGASVLFLEAAFLEEDADQARATGHLTTKACAEIALAAGVERLVPFHFSKRYEDRVEQAYGQIRRLCPAVVPFPEDM
ncbi:MAG: MBL fold metallo-hydrolase [Candidatus Nitrospinota bacterium M3_3B_026]